MIAPLITAPPSVTLPVVENGFGCVVADPPWRYGNTATRAAAENHYPTMSVEEICALPVAQIAAPQSHLYLWITAAHLPYGFQVMDAWGFEYKQYLVWVKTSGYEGWEAPEDPKLRIGLGNYFRHATELLLFGTRGGQQALVHNIPNVFWAPRQEHSRKPELLQAGAERLSPGPYLEMFARRPRQGWWAWGNQVPTEGSNAA